MKPVCKSEAKWIIWRIDNPRYWGNHFARWAKRYMAKARRRHYKVIQEVE